MKRNFVAMELFVAVGVVMILLAMLVPALLKARSRASAADDEIVARANELARTNDKKILACVKELAERNQTLAEQEKLSSQIKDNQVMIDKNELQSLKDELQYVKNEYVNMKEEYMDMKLRLLAHDMKESIGDDIQKAEVRLKELKSNADALKNGLNDTSKATDKESQYNALKELELRFKAMKAEIEKLESQLKFIKNQEEK